MSFSKIFKLLKQFLLFNLGNNLQFWAQLSLTFILTEVIKLWYMVSYGVALSITTIGLFFFQQFITFHQKPRELIKKLIRFTLITLGIYIPNWFLVLFITDWLNKNIMFKYNYILSIGITAIPYTLVYYLVCKEWLFRAYHRSYLKH